MKNWWNSLEPQWKAAFIKTNLLDTTEPSDEHLAQWYHTPVLRFAGPTAPYPNMDFELTNLSGIADLVDLEILVVTHQHLETIEELQNKSKLKSLFLFNNYIKSLKGIESLTQLEQLYVQNNQLESTKEIDQLTNLKELYIHDNLISSLAGITENHADHLAMFYCTPNKNLKQNSGY